MTSARNRGSIEAHGLDWTRMGDVLGISGSTEPEQAGCFVCRDEGEAHWFIHLNSTGGPVDVWGVEGVEEAELVESPEGHFFVPRTVPAGALTLVRRDVAPTDGADP